jgi:hypothetical protein
VRARDDDRFLERHELRQKLRPGSSAMARAGPSDTYAVDTDDSYPSGRGLDLSETVTGMPGARHARGTAFVPVPARDLGAPRLREHA